MKEQTLDLIRDMWSRETVRTSLMTSLTLVSGEIVLYLETCGDTTMRQLARVLEWPVDLIYLALGALVQQGVVRVGRTDGELTIRPGVEATVTV